tara:strand:- start:3949 stop:4350 length:402 start_codon:yes stop_codon:yes gene_type:complete
MALQRTKLLSIQSVTGIATVGILTVGTTQTAGGVGVVSTTYLRSVIMHNTGLGTATSSVYVYPSSEAVSGVGKTAYRLGRVDLASNETYFFEMNYPLVLVDQDKLVVEITAPGSGGTGIGSAINFQVIGDTDI